MTDSQKIIKYVAIALALVLIFAIFSGIAAIVRIVTFVNDGNAVSDEPTVYDVSDGITDLDFEISAAEFTVKTADRVYIESNLKNLKVNENGTKLSVVEKTKFNYEVTTAFLTLYVPEGHVFNDVDIDAGAGKISLGSFSCKTLTLDLGAGDFDAEELNISDTCDINGGVGEFTVHGGSISDLELEMGIGDMKLVFEIIGDCDFSFGIGNAEIIIVGSKDDHRIKVEKGIGTIRLDGVELSSDTTVGNGNTRINVNGGIGNIDIKFGE